MNRGPTRTQPGLPRTQPEIVVAPPPRQSVPRHHYYRVNVPRGRRQKTQRVLHTLALKERGKTEKEDTLSGRSVPHKEHTQEKKGVVGVKRISMRRIRGGILFLLPEDGEGVNEAKRHTSRLSPVGNLSLKELVVRRFLVVDFF